MGTGAANRSLPELQQMLGMIVNTLVLRTKVGGQMSFTDLLDQVQQTVIDTLAWSDTPVDAVIDAIGPTRDASRTPLFQVIFTFHDSAVPDVDFGGLTGAVIERANGVGQGRPQRDGGAAGLAAAGPGAPARGRRPEPDLGVLDRPVR